MLALYEKFDKLLNLYCCQIFCISGAVLRVWLIIELADDCRLDKEEKGRLKI